MCGPDCRATLIGVCENRAERLVRSCLGPADNAASSEGLPVTVSSHELEAKNELQERVARVCQEWNTPPVELAAIGLAMVRISQHLAAELRDEPDNNPPMDVATVHWPRIARILRLGVGEVTRTYNCDAWPHPPGRNCDCFHPDVLLNDMLGESDQASLLDAVRAVYWEVIGGLSLTYGHIVG